MPGVTLSSQSGDRHVRLSWLRSPWGGGRANRTTGRGVESVKTALRIARDALASPRGRVPAEPEHLLAATPERFVHRALRRHRSRAAEAAGRPRAAVDRHRPV